MFQGKPSPSLRKMQRMNHDELREHVARMEEERARTAARIEGLRKAGKPIAPGSVLQERRLADLLVQGKRLLAVQRPYA
jgi:hypothetical protein